MDGGIIVFLIIIVLVILIIVKLISFIFKPNIKKTKITKIDENGKEIVEWHETKDNTGSLAKVIAIIVLLGILFFVLMIVTVAINVSS